MADSDLRLVVSVPDLATLIESVLDLAEQVTATNHVIGVLVAAVDDVLARISALAYTQAQEQTQLRDVLTALRDQVAAGQVDQAKLDDAVTQLDAVIANTVNFVEAAQAAVTPPEPPVEP